MRRIFIYLKPTQPFFLLLIFCTLFSCAYFNTFYNAEASYKKALKMIEESNTMYEDEISMQAKKLLSEAIENSQIVIRKYPESKYIDDAVYIIAKASFLRDEVARAERYFIKLITFYPESKLYSLSEIWLAYTHLRMGMVDSSRNEITAIQSTHPKGKEKLYLIHNILAEIFLSEDILDSIYWHYEKAVTFANTKSKQTSMYGKLVKIAEDNLDKERASKYLVSLAEVAPDKIRIDSRMKWISYQREMGNYDLIITEIQRMLGMSEFQSEYLRLELELAKVYVSRGELELAKEMFGQLVENYSKKDETAEAYYQLGIISLKEDFNLSMARDYFESSKKEKSSSFYGRESRDYLNKITRYETLTDIFKESVKNPDEKIEINEADFQYEDDTENERGRGYESDRDRNDNDIRSDNFNIDLGYDMDSRLGNPDIDDNLTDKNYGPVGTSSDSILFMIGEMLLYDFNHLERALDKLKILAEEYPVSKFASQALYVLSHFQPSENWYSQLESNYPNSLFLDQDSTAIDTSMKGRLELKRDYAWSLSERSYEDSYVEFDRLYKEYNDTLSAYIRAFISDYYLNDIKRTVEHYQAFVESFPENRYFSRVNNRLEIIKKDLEIQKNISQQGIEYKNAVLFFQDIKDFDSTKILLDEIANGEDSPFKISARHLKKVIKAYKELAKNVRNAIEQDFQLIEEDSLASDKNMPRAQGKTSSDSLIYLFAELFLHELDFKDSATYYHRQLITLHPNSKYTPFSLIALADLESSNNWLDTLKLIYPDTTFVSDSAIYQLAYHPEIYQDDFLSSREELIQLCDTYLEYFAESIDSSLFPPDSSIILDSLTVPLDSLLGPVDSLVFSADTTIGKTDTTLLEKPMDKEEVKP